MVATTRRLPVPSIGNRVLKVLTTSTELSNSLASVLHTAFPDVALLSLESGAIDPAIHQDAELLFAYQDTEAEGTLIRQLLSQIRNLSLNLPLILLQREPNPERLIEGLRIGATDVVVQGEDRHLLQAVTRARSQRDLRQQLASWQRRYAACERRCERLMDSSRDAIAVISEGIHVYLNESYADMLGQNPDDLLLAPVTDVIAPDHQETITPLLRPPSGSIPSAADRRLIHFRRADGTEVKLEVQIHQIQYQDEPALQWIVHDTQVGAPRALTPTAPTQQPASNPETIEAQQVNLKRMVEHIARAMRAATDTQRPWLVHYVRVDEFHRLQGDAGVHLAELAMIGAWRFLRRHLDEDVPLGRVRDNAFLFVTSTHTPSDARRMAENLCRALEQETFTLEAQSVNLHFSMGIATIDGDHETPTSWMDRCLKAVQALDAEGSSTVSTPVRLFEELYPTSIASLNEENNVKQFVRRMLDSRMLGLAFQPIVALRDQHQEDYEVTTRQVIAELPAGIPQDVFKRAFRTSVAGDLDRWAILEAFRVLQSRLEQHPRTRLFLKISATSLRDPGFTSWLKMSFQAARLNPDCVAFQVEEKDATLSITATRALIEQLNGLGVKLGLTHYGLANPPGRLLADAHFAFAKPDQSLVLRAATSTEGVEQLSACINAAKEAGVKVIVPFVEDAAIIPLLWRLGVDYLQGYYIQNPSETMNYDFSNPE